MSCTTSSKQVLILTVSPVQSVRLWTVLKFYYEAICVSEQCLIVFLFMNTWNNQWKPIFHSCCRQQISLLLKWHRPPYSSQMFNKTASTQPPLLVFILRILLPFTVISTSVIITSSKWNMNNGSFPRLLIKILKEMCRLINQTLMHWIPTF